MLTSTRSRGVRHEAHQKSRQRWGETETYWYGVLIQVSWSSTRGVVCILVFDPPLAPEVRRHPMRHTPVIS